MATCPFCKATVSEDTARFGGNCPSCLIEIPGEEAATDPGEGRAVEVETSTNRGPLISGLVAAAVVLAAVGFWHFNQQPVPSPEGEERTSSYTPPPLSSHQNQDYPTGEASPEADAGEVASRRERSDRRNRTGGRVESGDREIAEGRVIPKATPILNPLDAFAVGSGPRVRGPQGIVLSDMGQIEAMVGRVLERGNKRLEPCYKQTTSVNPGYKGKWRVTVDIARDGTVEGISMNALSGADSGMERCIRSHVKRWTFQRIAEPITSSHIYRFGT